MTICGQSAGRLTLRVRARQVKCALNLSFWRPLCQTGVWFPRSWVAALGSLLRLGGGRGEW